MELRQQILAIVGPSGPIEAPSGWGFAPAVRSGRLETLGYLGGYNPATGLENVTFFEHAAGARRTVVQHLWLVVKDGANTMTAEFLHDRKTI